jgi:hypothetical protein
VQDRALLPNLKHPPREDQPGDRGDVGHQERILRDKALRGTPYKYWIPRRAM